MQPRILVTGAGGNIGREIVTQLRDANVPFRALTRDPAKAAFPDGIDVVHGDLTAPETLDACLDGVDAVFLVWLAPLAPAASAIERIAGHARRVVFLTAPIHTPHPFFQQPNPVRSVHAGVEQLIVASGLQWTFLRPHAFALNCLNWWQPQISNGDVVRWFHGDAATAPIHERDIAAAAVRALIDDAHAANDYVLTGPASLTQREQVQIIGTAIGRPLSFEELAPEVARGELVAKGWPPHIADMLMSAYAAAVGLPAYVTSSVQDVTGAPARSFREWATDHAADFSR